MQATFGISTLTKPLGSSVNRLGGMKDDTISRPPNKRRRIAHACETCRQRKSRCNGDRPTCDICTEQGLPCHYRDAATHSAVSSDRQSISKLENRLKDMERLLHSLTPGRASSEAFSPPVTLRSDAGDDSSLHNRNSLSVEPHLSPANIYHDRATSQQPGLAQDSVDGLGTITFADEASSGFFGTSLYELEHIVAADPTKVLHQTLLSYKRSLMRNPRAQDSPISILQVCEAFLDRHRRLSRHHTSTIKYHNQ